MKKIILNKYAMLLVQEEDENIALLGLPYPEVLPLSKLTTTNDTTITCKINASFFIMKSGCVLGRQQGVRPNFDKFDGAPHQNPDKTRYDVVITEDNQSHIGLFGCEDYRTELVGKENRVRVGYSVPCVLIQDGQYVGLTSTEIVNTNHLNTIRPFTYLGKFKNGKYFFATTDQYRPSTFGKELVQRGDIDFLVLNDGGGSAEAIANGQIIFNPDYSERYIPNCLIFYKWNTPEPKPQPKYDFTSAEDLVKWGLQQKDLPNQYNLDGGIGRYKNYFRQFDCTGLIKCFLWHDYSQYNTEYYKKYQDVKFSAYAKFMKPISTIPEEPGVIVWQPGKTYEHVGIYLGDGKVLETTPYLNGCKQNHIIISNFRDKNSKEYRDTWVNWFRHPNLKYKSTGEEEEMYLTVLKNGMSFREQPDGKIIESNIQIGSKALVRSIEDKVYKNNFRWAKVLYKNQEGYIQLDYDYIYLSGSCSGDCGPLDEQIKLLKEENQNLKENMKKIADYSNEIDTFNDNIYKISNKY